MCALIEMRKKHKQGESYRQFLLGKDTLYPSMARMSCTMDAQKNSFIHDKEISLVTQSKKSRQLGCLPVSSLKSKLTLYNNNLNNGKCIRNRGIYSPSLIAVACLPTKICRFKQTENCKLPLQLPLQTYLLCVQGIKQKTVITTCCKAVAKIKPGEKETLHGKGIGYFLLYASEESRGKSSTCYKYQITLLIYAQERFVFRL